MALLKEVSTRPPVSFKAITPAPVDVPLSTSATVVPMAFVPPTSVTAMKLRSSAVIVLFASASSMSPVVAVRLTSAAPAALIVSTSIAVPFSVMSSVSTPLVVATLAAVIAPAAVTRIDPLALLKEVSTTPPVSFKAITPAPVDVPLTTSATVVPMAFVPPTSVTALKLKSSAVTVLLASASSMSPVVAVRLTSPAPAALIVSTSIEEPLSVMPSVFVPPVVETLLAVIAPPALTLIEPLVVVTPARSIALLSVTSMLPEPDVCRLATLVSNAPFTPEAPTPVTTLATNRPVVAWTSTPPVSPPSTTPPDADVRLTAVTVAFVVTRRETVTSSSALSEIVPPPASTTTPSLMVSAPPPPPLPSASAAIVTDPLMVNESFTLTSSSARKVTAPLALERSVAEMVLAASVSETTSVTGASVALIVKSCTANAIRASSIRMLPVALSSRLACNSRSPAPAFTLTLAPVATAILSPYKRMS